MGQKPPAWARFDQAGQVPLMLSRTVDDSGVQDPSQSANVLAEQMVRQQQAAINKFVAIQRQQIELGDKDVHNAFLALDGMDVYYTHVQGLERMYYDIRPEAVAPVSELEIPPFQHIVDIPPPLEAGISFGVSFAFHDFGVRYIGTSYITMIANVGNLPSLSKMSFKADANSFLFPGDPAKTDRVGPEIHDGITGSAQLTTAGFFSGGISYSGKLSGNLFTIVLSGLVPKVLDTNGVPFFAAMDFYATGNVNIQPVGKGMSFPVVPITEPIIPPPPVLPDDSKPETAYQQQHIVAAAGDNYTATLMVTVRPFSMSVTLT